MRLPALLLFAGVLSGQPRLFLNEADFQRIREQAARGGWAADTVASIQSFAAAWPRSYLDRYALGSLAVPEKGGQWSHHYVCPRHGVALAFGAPATHRCPIDGERFSGWPYDDVILSRRHDELANAARDLALAYRLTGDRTYAEKSAWILSAYAGLYLTYAHHDKDGRNTRTGARAHAQTLDESIWLIPLAWAHDLLSDSGVLTGDERAKVERDLLRAAVDTIQRYDAGISNWQSWHNAGVGAVAFTLNDRALIDWTVDGKSGFRFQMNNSVEGEGFWYEGAWGYHFYALDALMQTAEMATRNGIDLWREPKMRGLFTTPLRLSFPDGTLPAFNDSQPVSLYGYDRLYEVALARTGDPSLAGVLGRRTRPRNALFWGMEELPPAGSESLSSEVFQESGFAVLRTPADHTVMMKFGPHGGGHGHYDKLGLISFAFGGILGLDPGTQSYAAPTHNTWDKQTVAHNTVVVDERTQGEATGKLHWFQQGDGFAAVRADAGGAYKSARLDRTLVVTGEYTLDLFEAASLDGAPHQFDWVYHNPGRLEMDLVTTPFDAFPSGAGYQHLTANRAGAAETDWMVRFDGSTAGAVAYGTTYQSTANVRARFERTPEIAYSGNGAGKASYTFQGPGYVMFTTPALTAMPAAKPEGLAVWIYGDGSGNRLALRLYDSTDERFVATIGAVNWKGWKRLEVRDPESWTHYLGDNDGVFDAPVRSVAVEVTAVEGAAGEGALFVDDIGIGFADGLKLVEDFEFRTRSLRVWMLGEPGTMVVGGEGLGPDLRVNVPYVMARRRGLATSFVSLLEPYRDQPRITGIERVEANRFRIKGSEWTDEITLQPAGLDYRRVPLP